MKRFLREGIFIVHSLVVFKQIVIPLMKVRIKMDDGRVYLRNQVPLFSEASHHELLQPYKGSLQK